MTSCSENRQEVQLLYESGRGLDKHTHEHTPGPGSSFTAAQMAPTAPFTPSTTSASICHPTSLENSEDEEDVCFCACEVNIPDLSEWFPVLSLSFRFSITLSLYLQKSLTVHSINSNSYSYLLYLTQFYSIPSSS